MSLKLFPVPRKVTTSARKFDYRAAAWIRLPASASAILKRQALALAAEVAPAFARPPTVTAAAPAAGSTFVEVRLKPAGKALKPQGYRLTATPDAVILEAADEAGAYYGLQTLRQAVSQCGAVLPAMTIEDWPDIPRRGVMLDISRCKVPTMATLYALIENLARWKINEVQLYTEHTFAYSAHADVWHDSSPVTAADVLALDAFCRERYVELVPNQNSFGHFERWLKYPQYRPLAECPDGHEWPWGGRSTCGSTLAPRQESLDFLKSLYTEFLPNFTSPLLNIGCDETWELGQGWSKSRCDKRGKTRVYLDFLLEIRKLARASGRQVMFWGDIILHQPELIKELEKDMIALEWGYEDNHPFAEHCPLFAASGIPFYVCPGTSSWNSITGRTRNAVGNLANAARNGRDHGAIGFLNTDWGDGGHHQYQPVSYVGFAAGAAYSWCHQSNEKVDIAAAISRDLFADDTGILGRLFYELGELRELVKGRSGNSTVFNALLFWDMDPAHLNFKDITPAMLRKCLARLDQLEGQVADARPRAADGALAAAEFLNAAAMARHATRRGLTVLEKRDDRAELRTQLHEIIGHHSELWLARNRPGGLHESSGRLRGALQALNA